MFNFLARSQKEPIPMSMRRKLGTSTNRKKLIYGGETLDIEHVHNATRKPYMPPIIIHLEPGDVRGGQITRVLEATSGLLASS